MLVALQIGKASACMFRYRSTQFQDACCSTQKQSFILQVPLQIHSFRMLVALQMDKASSCRFLYRYTASGCLLLYTETKLHPAGSSTDTQLQDACCSTNGQSLILQVPLQIDNAPTCMFLYRSTQLQDACCSTERQSLILQVLLQIHSFRILVALQRDKASSSMFFCRQ